MGGVSPTQWNYRSQVAFSKPTAFSPSFLDGSGNNLLYVCYTGKYVVICRVLARKIPEIDCFWFYNTEPNFPDIFGEKKDKKLNTNTLKSFRSQNKILGDGNTYWNKECGESVQWGHVVRYRRKAHSLWAGW